ncbi:MAG: glycosyltransferase family 2 protein [Pseudomonadota bacterium]
MPSLNICICTCKRETLLVQCLESVSRVDVPPGLGVIVTVVDNDDGRSAEGAVQALTEWFPFPLRYVSEPRRGIPLARNRALDETYLLGSDYLAFIDDDEWVRTDWLRRLYEYEQTQGGNIIVSGEVVPELPDNTPSEIRGLYKTKNRKTGERVDSCATNNVLVPVSMIRDWGLRFDESNPLAGGTDTIFFHEAVARGAVIRKCAEALVHEAIPASRANLKWLAKRKYRAGITEAWRKQRKGRPRLVILLAAALRVLSAVIRSGLTALMGNKLARNQNWLKACKSAGVFAGVFGLKVDSYRQIES